MYKFIRLQPHNPAKIIFELNENAGRHCVHRRRRPLKSIADYSKKPRVFNRNSINSFSYDITLTPPPTFVISLNHVTFSRVERPFAPPRPLKVR